MSIAETFSALRAQGKMAFMPFITAGDPDLEFTTDLIRELAARKVDLIEIGFPYSDPIADGPVIQASYNRSLGKKITVEKIFAALKTLKGTDLPPLVGMVAYAIIFRVGTEKFLKTAKESGLSGLIIPDLPGDEADGVAQLCREVGLDLIELVAPTTTPERAEKIVKNASGFLYCISIAGITGERDKLPPELREQLTWLRTKTDIPLAVGFGISRPEHVRELKGLADGAIVGSAIVRLVGEIETGSKSRAEVLKSAGELAGQLLSAARA
ncbi:MAG: tryptophan synthase subunit alpha [Planctomycetaceae bacterium]|nr:tryptophan synthase subunit alpha [Planctomycetaceae bacterium]